MSGFWQEPKTRAAQTYLCWLSRRLSCTVLIHFPTWIGPFSTLMCCELHGGHFFSEQIWKWDLSKFMKILTDVVLLRIEVGVKLDLGRWFRRRICQSCTQYASDDRVKSFPKNQRRLKYSYWYEFIVRVPLIFHQFPPPLKGFQIIRNHSEVQDLQKQDKIYKNIWLKELGHQKWLQNESTYALYISFMVQRAKTVATLTYLILGRSTLSFY